MTSYIVSPLENAERLLNAISRARTNAETSQTPEE